MMMTNSSVMNPVADMCQAQLEASWRFADAFFSGIQKIDRIILDAIQQAFSEQLRLAQGMIAVRDSRGFASLQAGLLPKPDGPLNRQQELMQVFAEMQHEIGNSMQQYMEQLGVKAVSNSSRPLALAQERMTDALFNPMASLLSMWEAAFSGFTTLADKNMRATRPTLESAANAAGTLTENARNAAVAVSNASARPETGEEKKGGPAKRK
jgi:hypothetical protein